VIVRTENMRKTVIEHNSSVDRVTRADPGMCLQEVKCFIEIDFSDRKKLLARFF